MLMSPSIVWSVLTLTLILTLTLTVVNIFF